MYEARNAVDIAKSKGDEKYAPGVFSKALGSAQAHLTGTFQTQGEEEVVNLKLDAPGMPVNELEPSVLFYDGDEPPSHPPAQRNGYKDWASKGRGARYLSRLRRTLEYLNDEDCRLLMHMAHHMARRSRQ